MTRYIFILLLILILPRYATAQIDSTHQQHLPSLVNSYYNDITFLSQKYNYDLLNKKHALKTKSNNILVAGICIAIGSGIAIGITGEKNGWSTFASVSTGLVVAGGVIVPTVIWSNHLRKKANLIQVETAYLLPIGKHTELGAAFFSSGKQFGNNAIGIGFKTTF